MNLASQADAVQRHALARSGFAADLAVTMLHIGRSESVVVSGRADESPLIVGVALGSASTGRALLRHDPPTPLELEQAIDRVEGEVMPLARRLPRASTLVASGEAIQAIARAAAKTGQSSLALDEVERLFQQLAAVAQGRPASSSGLPPGADFAATLLILREFMHHLGFEAILVGRELDNSRVG